MTGSPAVLRVCLVNLALLLAGLLMGEIIFGTWFFGPNFGFLNVPRNVELRHDLGKQVPGAGISVYRKDAYGFRGDYGGPDRIQVLVIGGSTTNELYVGEGATWVDVLGGHLKAAGIRLVMANAGVDGHSTVGHIKSFERWFPLVPGLRPRYVLAFVGLNDINVRIREKFDRLEDEGAWRRLRRRVSNNSALYNLYRIVKGMVQARKARIMHGHRNTFHKITSAHNYQPAKWRPAIDAYGGRLGVLARRIRAFGARPIFVTQIRGDVFEEGGETYVSHPDSFNEWQRLQLYNAKTMEVCRSAGGICVDLGAELRLERTDFYDRVHTLPRGSAKIGRYLSEKLRGHLNRP